MEGPRGPSMGTPIYHVGLACSSCSRCSPLEPREPLEPGAPAKIFSWLLSRIMGHVPRSITVGTDFLRSPACEMHAHKIHAREMHG